MASATDTTAATTVPRVSDRPMRRNRSSRNDHQAGHYELGREQSEEIARRGAKYRRGHERHDEQREQRQPKSDHHSEERR